MRMPTAVAVFLITAGATDAASAVDLINRDAQPHTIVLLQAGQPTRFVIAPHVSFRRVCTACTVEIDGTRRIDAEDSDSVTIREGVPQIGG